MKPLIDGHGRPIGDIRVSVTDRCNFRCQYCMPAEGMQWLPRSEVLTFEEIERITRVCVEHFGVDRERWVVRVDPAGGDRPQEVGAVVDPDGELAAVGDGDAGPDRGRRLDHRAVDAAVHDAPRRVVVGAEVHGAGDPGAADLGDVEAGGGDEGAAGGPVHPGQLSHQASQTRQKGWPTGSA